MNYRSSNVEGSIFFADSTGGFMQKNIPFIYYYTLITDFMEIIIFIIFIVCFFACYRIGNELLSGETTPKQTIQTKKNGCWLYGSKSTMMCRHFLSLSGPSSALMPLQRFCLLFTPWLLSCRQQTTVVYLWTDNLLLLKWLNHLLMI